MTTREVFNKDASVVWSYNQYNDIYQKIKEQRPEAYESLIESNKNSNDPIYLQSYLSMN